MAIPVREGEIVQLKFKEMFGVSLGVVAIPVREGQIVQPDENPP